MKRVVAALIVAGTLLLSAQTAPHSPLLHATRQAPTDLEVGGAISVQANLSRTRTCFIYPGQFHDLHGCKLSRTGSSERRRSRSAAAFVGYRCGYGAGDMQRRVSSHYPASYLAAHHPVLVLTVNGKSQEGWPKAETASSWDLM